VVNGSDTIVGAAILLIGITSLLWPRGVQALVTRYNQVLGINPTSSWAKFLASPTYGLLIRIGGGIVTLLGLMTLAMLGMGD